MQEKAKVIDQPFNADVVQRDGSIRSKRYNLKVIKVRNGEERIERQGNTTNEGVPVSNVTPLSDSDSTFDNIIQAPYDQLALINLEEESNVLRECVDSMVTNIEGFGHVYRPRKLDEDSKKKFASEIEKEGIFLDGWLDAVCPEISFIETRKRMRRDLELTGNGYWELVRTSNGEIIQINHVRSHRMRITKLDEEYTLYKIPVVRPDKDYQIEYIEKRKRFRRYVQLDSTGKPTVYFKEFGDPREIDKNTGEVKSNLAVGDEATEMVHFSIYSARTVYGIPRYIGRFVSLIGSRRAEEVNYFTISNNYIPSMFVMVDNGTLTEKSIERLTELIESQIAPSPNFSQMVILEADSAENESFAGQSTAAKIHIHEPQDQKTDQMYQEYDKNNAEKVRQAFRLPPLLIGRSEDYTRATAHESVRVADEQIFHPERSIVDHLMSRIMLDQGFRWHFLRSRTPNITDNQVLVRFMGTAEKSGAMTPRRADMLAQDVFEGDLGPMPENIDLDTPYSLQFAQAQNAQRPPNSPNEPNQPSGEPTERSEKKWIDQYVNEILRGAD
jgi:PBSX family phage portal protein